jgi:hypothetical protein
VQFALRVLLDVNLYAHNFHTTIVIGLFKRDKLSILRRNLETVEYHQNNEISPYLTFIISHLVVLWSVTAFAFYVWIDFFGVAFLKLYNVQYLQMYSQFFYILVAFIILKMVRSKYNYQNVYLKEQLLIRKSLPVLILIKTQNNVLVLRETLNIINDIFGWTILLNIFSRL